MTDDELEDIKRRCSAAMPGPWVSFIEGRDHTSGSSFIRTSGEDIEMVGASDADQDFVAHARQDVPRLLQEVIKLKSVLKAVLMTTGDKNSSSVGLKEHVDIEKSADILQATFQHYFDMAMDHNAKAATTTNILLVVVGAIIAIMGRDNEIKGIVDSGGAIAVCVIGIFGVVWVRKQQERYHYWQSIALQYQGELTQIVPLLKPRNAYEKHAENVAAEEVGPILARRIYERHLWVALHVIVVILGLGLLLISMM